jgi:quercetin dioxygenase-like cupin family protein
VLHAGDVLYFPPRTWHWGYNFGIDECRILESLTPRTEAAVEAFAKRQTWPEELRYALPGMVGGLLPGKAESAARATLIRPADCRSEIVGVERPMRVDIAVSTEMLTTAFVNLHPGQRSEPIAHPGEKVLMALEGQLNLHFPDEAGSWWELRPGDAAFIPGGCRHLFFSTSDARARFLFSVAPTYR